jgi:hypothetical protein
MPLGVVSSQVPSAYHQHAVEGGVCFPLGFSVNINEEPLSGGAFPAALEHDVHIYILTMATQR